MNEEPKITTWKEWTIWIWGILKQYEKQFDESNKRIDELQGQVDDLSDRLLVFETKKKTSWNTITIIALVIFNILTLIVTYLSR